METTAVATVGPDVVRAIAEAGDEPAWLAQWRHDAWDAYEGAALPDRVAHLWRYSEPAKFLPDRVAPIVPDGAGPAAAARQGSGGATAAAPPDEAAAILIQDGEVRSLHVADELREAGLVLTDLATGARAHEALVREHLGRAAGADAGKFEALNAALFAGGVLLYVPPELSVPQPVYLTQRGTRDLSGLFPRVLVIVDRGAEVTVIDEYVNEGAPRVLANSVIEGTVQADARLAYFNIQRWGARTRSHANQRFLVQRNASVTTVNIGLGGLYNKADLGNVQCEDGAQAEMIGVVFGGDRQHFDNHTEHIHRAGNSLSDMDFKVVLEDHARSVYTGLIRIDLEARNCEAYQENRNLMLDPTCQAESIPELEILNQDVRCTHGATVGPIDEEQVYYLRTRGLSETEAERLIVEGFFGPALDRIQEPGLRERLWGYVEEKLEGRTT